MNAWGSGKGRGKACKNGRRAILVGRSDDYSKTEGARLNVPPTSVKRLAEYSKKLRELGRPLISVITRINLEPSDSGGFDMYFEPAEPINDPKTLDVLRKRVSEGYESLVALPSAEARVEKAEEKSSPVKSRAQKRR